MLRSFLRSPIVLGAVSFLLGGYLWFALRTTRWTLLGGEHLRPHALGAPAIMASWHERLALMPAQWRMVRRCRAGSRIHILVSRSRDGRFIAGIVARFGIDVALGSSSRGGAAAMRQMVGVLAAGGHVGMTPDGPRGPRRRAAPGVVQLAALAGVPILPCSAQVSRKWVLRSWDRMVIPRPFGRGVVVCGEVISVPREGWREALPVVEGALTAVAEAADRWCAERAGG